MGTFLGTLFEVMPLFCPIAMPAVLPFRQQGFRRQSPPGEFLPQLPQGLCLDAPHFMDGDFPTFHCRKPGGHFLDGSGHVLAGFGLRHSTSASRARPARIAACISPSAVMHSRMGLKGSVPAILRTSAGSMWLSAQIVSRAASFYVPMAVGLATVLWRMARKAGKSGWKQAA